MAATDLSPNSWLGPSFSVADGKISFELADYPELTSFEVDPQNGDVRKLLFGLMEGLYAKWRAKSQALATTDRPTKTRMTKSVSEDETTGTITRTYSVRFELAPPGPGSFEVSDEPTS